MKYEVRISWWADNLVNRDYNGDVWCTYSGYDEENAEIEEYATEEEAKARVKELKSKAGGYVKTEIKEK